MLDLFRLFHNESVPEAGDGAGVSAGAVDASEGSGGAAPTAPEAPAAPTEAPSWAGPSQTEWEQVTGTIGQLAQLIQQASEPPAPAAPDLEALFYENPQAYAETIRQQAEATARAQLEPILPLIERQIENEGNTIMQGLFEQWKNELGEFDPDTVRNSALGYIDQFGGDAERALRHAAEVDARRVKALNQRAIDEYKQSLQGRSPTDDPAANGSALELVDAPKTYDDVIARFTQQHAT